jgi:hypothetical protein
MKIAIWLRQAIFTPMYASPVKQMLGGPFGQRRNMFIPGMELSRKFYSEAVEPIIRNSFPSLKYAAGLIDYGSDVLGYDTKVSQDHQWGPRLSLFLSEEDISGVGGKLDNVLSENLPATFYGYSTSFSGTKEDYIRHMEISEKGNIKHIIRIHTLEEFIQQHLGIDIHEKINDLNWLLFPQQKLLTIRKGQLFHDDLHANEIKQKLEYYPNDIWYYLMACEWNKINVEEAFVGRCGDVNDDIGSRLIASRIIQSIMTICFFQEKNYMPYSKWFGTAFNELKSAKTLNKVFKGILNARNWKTREHYLSEAYIYIAKQHNLLQITKYIEPCIQKYYSRDYKVIFADRFANELFSSITDDTIRNINKIGSIDQITNVLSILQSSDQIYKSKVLY